MSDIGDTFDPYLRFDREAWSALRAQTPLSLTEADLAALRGISDRLSLDEVEHSYLPLSRLLNLHVAASQSLHRVTSTFVGRASTKRPYIIAIAGSVAVGKSTAARVLQALLSRWPDHPRVDLITTDGFLFPNAVLEERGIMHRKGFPESYDVKALIAFLGDVEAGRPAAAPVYSHLSYDIIDEQILVDRPDILILEGINVLQTPRPGEGAVRFVSDFFDFSIYVDADEDVIRTWFFERFELLRDTAFRDPDSYFHRYAQMSRQEALAFADHVWTTINGVNLRDNILPTRDRATLILGKGADHRIDHVALRRL